ncbi:hypothetical protein NX722_28600 [Endozoicomonas gorgoniicola]|uniref:Amphi-Trp domain-containing protein n=1 Tax=Endozoicomonas gorgoniicola TaxID=1234144 RepID=A0ABT3N5B7_9GAMM|nr:hypothetical protein [Endozoicomonas gorgoniicola]MCW7556451.1 hypothetical protein [Endozoicomonas gorgoniicola]MCW7556528.1 hypothetical protein [Endozoicomonas gorgoniicola]
MAELVLTEKEKADPTYLDWSDEALGKLVKRTAIKMQDEFGQDAAHITCGAHLLISLAEKSNSAETTLTFKGVSHAGEPKGDWKIVITRTDT